MCKDGHTIMSSEASPSSRQSLTQLLSSLSPTEVEALQIFHKRISEKDFYVSPNVMREHPVRFCLRYLRADDFNVSDATERYQEYVQLTKEFNFENIAESLEQEYSEDGPMFVCGRDAKGNIVIVCRPCSHLPKTEEDSEKAAARCIYTMQLCADRMSPGHERATMIYDASGVSSANWDITFVKKISKMLGTCFPERIGKILMCNNGFLVSTLWKIVKTFLDPVTAQKIIFCGTRFETNLVPLLPPKHPYLAYLISRRDAKKQSKSAIKLPKSDGYTAQWEQSVTSDYQDLQSWGAFKRFKLINDSRCIENFKLVTGDHADGSGRGKEGGDSSSKKADAIVKIDCTDGIDKGEKESGTIPPPGGKTVAESEEEGRRDSSSSVGNSYNSLNLVEKDSSSIYAVAKQLYRVLEIKDRTYHFTTYNSCFLGSDCVAFLIALGLARTIDQAEALGDSLISKRLIQHVTNDHGLKNAYLFYHFLDFKPEDSGKDADKDMLMIHPMLPKYLNSLGVFGERRSPSALAVNRVIGQLQKRGKGRVRWNQRHIIIKDHIFSWKYDVSSEGFNGKISLKDYICKPCKSLTSKNFFVFKLVDVHRNCMYFGSSNQAEVLNWVRQIHMIQAAYVSEVLDNVNNAFAEMIQKFNSQYQLTSETNAFMKDPATIASLVYSFRALSQRGSFSYPLDVDLEAGEIEEEVLL